MTVTLIAAESLPGLGRAEAAAIAAEENRRFVELVSSFGGDDWSKPTDCTEWDVRALVSHVVGAMEGHISMPAFIHQLRAGNKAAGDRPAVDGMTEVQVAERAHMTPGDLVARLQAIGVAAARRRAARPSLLRRMSFKVDVDGVMEPWTFGYFFDVILTRDTWMHRVDLTRATGRPMALTAEHDGRIVADVVAEWARRHGQPFTLRLTGPAGATFTAGDAGEAIEMDAVEFCRVVSGRGSGTGLLAQSVPF